MRESLWSAILLASVTDWRLECTLLKNIRELLIGNLNDFDIPQMPSTNDDHAVIIINICTFRELSADEWLMLNLLSHYLKKNFRA